jgi:hypothetical protein
MRDPQVRSRLASANFPYGLEVDFSGVPDPATVELEKSVLVTSGGTPVPGDLSWPSANKLRYELPLNEPRFAAGTYDVVLRGDDPDAISSLAAGDNLDGEPNPSWPTGDGSPEGNFAFSFDVRP